LPFIAGFDIPLRMADKGTSYRRAGKRTPNASSTAKTSAEGARADISIEDELWEAAVKLRGNIAPADYKHYVLPLLFLRYLSLAYEQRRSQLEDQIHDKKSEYFTDDPKVAAAILADADEYKRMGVFIVPTEARWKYLVQHAQDDDIKLKIDRAMEVLEQTYPELRGVLPKIYAGSNLDRENVTGLINLFAREIFSGEAGRNSDILGRVYEYFITNFADSEGVRGGEFLTPRSIVKLLVAMIAPRRGKVFDPASGSCGMFVQSDEFTRHNHELAFYGQERVDTTLRLGRMNLILHGLNGDIHLGNSLLDDKHPRLRADFVVANPPFNQQGWGANKIPNDDKRLQIGSRKITPTDGNANYFWIAHFLHHLKDGGTAGFVMANGAMTTNLNEEKEARVALVEEDFVDCIVQLPDRLFFGSGIPVCLWFLSKNRDGNGPYRRRKGEVLFIDARGKGRMVTRRLRAMTDEEIAEIAATYQHFREAEGERQEIPGFCKTATIKDIRKHDHKLTPGIYVGTEAEEVDDTPFEVRMSELKKQLKAAFAESNTIQRRITNNLGLSNK